MCPHAQILKDGSFKTRKIRCVLIHDHILLRQGLRRLLEDESDIEVVAEAGTVAEALQGVSQKQPDIVITDANIFDCAADQTEWLLLQESPNSKVLFLTMHDDLPHREESTSCAVRQSSAEDLVEKVHRTCFGENARETASPRVGRLRKRVLTAREREVVKLLAEGRTVRSVADVLGVSMKTVDAHKFNLMRKLGLHNKAELVMWAIQKRVVKLPANS